MTFDLDKLVRIGRAYNLETNIQTALEEGDGGDGSDGFTEGANTPTLNLSTENRDIKSNMAKNNVNPALIIENVVHPNDERYSPSSLEPSRLSQPSPLNQSSGNDSPYSCYHIGCGFHTDDELEYQRHGALKHHKNPLLYPSKAEIKAYGLQFQGKSWEI